MWTFVELRVQIFAWQLSLTMIFALNLWAKYRIEGFKKGGGFQAEKKKTALWKICHHIYTV